MGQDDFELVHGPSVETLATDFCFEWMLTYTMDAKWVAEHKKELKELRARLMELPLDV